MRVTPHIARNDSYWGSAVLAKLAQTPRYQVSQRKRKRVEEIFGCAKSVGRGRKLCYLGLERDRLWTEMTAVACNVVHLSNLAAVPTRSRGKMTGLDGPSGRRNLHAGHCQPELPVTPAQKPPRTTHWLSSFLLQHRASSQMSGGFSTLSQPRRCFGLRMLVPAVGANPHEPALNGF